MTRLAAAMAALLVLSGCSQDDTEPESRTTSTAASTPAAENESTQPADSAEPAVQAEVDRCYTVGSDDGPDYDSAVDCSEQHSTEVYLVLDMPADLVDEDRSMYERDTELRALWYAWADAGCGAALQELSGVSAYASAFGVEQPGLVLPAFWGTYVYSLTPAEEWEAGQYKTVCAARTNPASPSHLQPAPAGEWVPTLATGQQDPLLTLCLAAGSQDYVPCSEEHYGEAIGLFNAAYVSSLEGILDTVDPADVSAAQYAKLDPICDKGVAELGDGRFKGLAYVNPETWNADDSGSTYVVTCVAQPKDKKLNAVGSVFSPSTLELVPAGGPNQ